MAANVIIEILIVLSLMVAIEWTVVFLFGCRKHSVFLAVALINMITNPLLNGTIASFQYLNLLKVTMPLILIFEFAVVLVEWRLLKLTMDGSSTRILFLSFTMNLSSFVVGLLIFPF